MKTPTEIIGAARAALAEISPHLTTGKATFAAMRELLTMWDGLALSPGFSGSAMFSDMQSTINNIERIQRAILAADVKSLAKSIRQFTLTKSITTVAFETACDHPATDDDDRHALRRLMWSYGSNDDRTRISLLADRIDPPNSDEIIREIMDEKLFNPVSGYDVEIDTVCDYLAERPNVPRWDRVTDFKSWLSGVHLPIAVYILTNAELFALAKRSIESNYTRRAAAAEMVSVLRNSLETPKTPAGDRYTIKAVDLAMSKIDATLAAALTK